MSAARKTATVTKFDPEKYAGPVERLTQAAAQATEALCEVCERHSGLKAQAEAASAAHDKVIEALTGSVEDRATICRRLAVADARHEAANARLRRATVELDAAQATYAKAVNALSKVL